MTLDRMIELLKVERECVQRNSQSICDRNCEKCDIVQDDKELQDMYSEVISLLSKQHTKIVPLNDLYSLPENDLYYLETRKTLRQAFTLKHYIYPKWCCRNEIDRHKLELMTTANLSRRWEFALYGKTWRLWTGKPSEEQREEAKWND